MGILYLTEPGTRVHKFGETLRVETPDGVLRKVPLNQVDLVIVFGGVHLSTPVLHDLLLRGVDCVFCSRYGKVHGRLVSSESALGEVRVAQAAALVEEFRAVLVDPLALGLARRGVLSPEDFRTDPEAPGAVLLRPPAMRKVVGAFEARLEEKTVHPFRGERLTYRQVVDAQARELAGALRNRTEYRPFRMR